MGKKKTPSVSVAEMDTTHLRNELDRMQAPFPRGYRRPELVALYESAVANGGAPPEPNINKDGYLNMDELRAALEKMNVAYDPNSDRDTLLKLYYDNLSEG